MSTLFNLRGRKIKFLTSDLSGTEGEGEIFYSNTDSKFKVGVSAAAWSSSSPQTTGRDNTAGFGLQTAAILLGGAASPQAIVEEYDGTGWSAGGNLNTARWYATGMGLQTAGLCVGGYNSGNKDEVESYDGSTWTEVGDINTARRMHAGFGLQGAAIIATGLTTAHVANAESWDGSSWTEVGDVNSARGGMGGGTACGTSTAGLIFSGHNPPTGRLALTESWDGSSWTEVGDQNTARSEGQSSSNGTQTAALLFGGGSGGGGGTLRNICEEWMVLLGQKLLICLQLDNLEEEQELLHLL